MGKPLSEQYLAKIKELCVIVDGNLLAMPAAIQAIHALINEFEKQQSEQSTITSADTI